MVVLSHIITILASYLLGAVPFGLLFTKLFSGIDVRSVGSGNIGATNVLRAAGKKIAVLTLLADGLKGFLPVYVARLLFHDEWTTALSGAAAVLGHVFPVWLRFKGGKGVATSFGVVLAVSPWVGLIALLAWLTAAIVWRYSSLSALVAFASYPLITFIVPPEPSKPFGSLSLFIFGMIYYRHRENIKRLVAGTEPKIGNK
ncbi:MAG: glycerol-3-phosphate 1-O-acyltransferase PlsY [Nitrospirota bacterium]